MQPRRLVTLLAGIALVLAACGGGAIESATPADNASTAPTADATQATTVPTTAPSAESTDETTEPAVERPAPDPNREMAPDFRLQLGDGSTFILSEETRPVFMVFWAEW